MTIEEQTKQAENWFEQGRVTEAKRLLERLLREAPDNVNVLNNLGVIAYHEGQFDTAISYFHRCLEIDPGNEDGFVNLIALLSDRNDLSGMLNVCWHHAESVASASKMQPYLEDAVIRLVQATVEQILGQSSRQTGNQREQDDDIIQQMARRYENEREALNEFQQFLTALGYAFRQPDAPKALAMLDRMSLQAPVLQAGIALLKAVLMIHLGRKEDARQQLKTIQDVPFFANVRARLYRHTLPDMPRQSFSTKKVLVLIDHRGILKLFVNMLLESPEVLRRYEFHFVVSDYYRQAQLFGPTQELATLEDLQLFKVSYDLWSFLKFIDNGSVEHSVVLDRNLLLHRYPELMQEAAHQFCLRYNPNEYDLIITGLRSQTLVPMLRFAGYPRAIILYPVAPFLYYPFFRSHDNEFIKTYCDFYTEGCFHVVAGDFYEDMYVATFPNHPFRLVKIPHGVKMEYYGQWQGDRETIFFAHGGITNSGSPLNAVLQYLRDRDYPLDIFGYLCYEKTNAHCNADGAPELALRESMIHSQVAIQYFVSHQMIGYVEKLAVGIPTIGIIPPQHLMPVTPLTQQYRAEIDFIDRDSAVPLQEHTNVGGILESKLKALLSSQEKRETMSAYLRKICRERYHFGRYKQQWQELLDLAAQHSIENALLWHLAAMAGSMPSSG